MRYGELKEIVEGFTIRLLKVTKINILPKYGNFGIKKWRILLQTDGNYDIIIL